MTVNIKLSNPLEIFQPFSFYIQNYLALHDVMELRKNIEQTLRQSKLVAGYLKGELSDSQQDELLDWISESEHNRNLFEQLCNEENLNHVYTTFSHFDESHALEKVKSNPAFTKSIPAVRPRLWPRIAAAAATIILITSAGLFFYQQNSKTGQTTQLAKNDLAPGGNKAFLTLANGKKISLTDAANGAVAKQQGVSITKTADGQLVYTAANNQNSDPAAIAYNTIETPRGGQYQVQLPDGSKVWLNAASSLKYPSSFATAANRRVQLTGEGYFEIAKDKTHPFIVESKGQQVEVLGTHFNINTYEDEPSIKTALLEGSIRLSGNGFEQTLAPGQEARRNGSTIKILPNDEEETLAWKNGQFVFNDESLESIMRKIARWYDVEIKYENVDPGQTFWGSFSRYANVSAVLKKLTLTGGIKFRIEGKTIYVLPDRSK